MKTFIREFQDRCNDVAEYFRLLEFMDSIATNKHKSLESESHQSGVISYLPNRECQKILRANFYLILYNLVESTLNSIISVVKDTVNDEKVPLERLVTSLFNLHIGGLYKNVTSQNRILEISKDLFRKTANKENVLLEKLGFNTSGNVDYVYFQKVVNAIGCRGRLVIDENRVKIAMDRTKNHRNKLAHGNWSFSNAGSLLTLSQIKEDHQCIVEYLNQSLHNLESFLDDKKYIKQ